VDQLIGILLGTPEGLRDGLIVGQLDDLDEGLTVCLCIAFGGT
jgi:hypothetical protein